MEKHVISDLEISTLLAKKVEIEKELETLLKERAFPHFSSKKFIGDLGEYYAKINLDHLFEPNTLRVMDVPNAPCDMQGLLKDEIAQEWGVPKEVSIEVKTRYHQLGSPHLKGLHPDKFDLLVFVSLNNDYSCHYVGILKNEDVEPDKQMRISFSNFASKVVYPKNIKFEAHR
ncbi:MAG: hypothetical protein BWY67_00278 [Bacteroidetes bacterium ADurb.Bin397]|nr:MAG: hypothetical protein BWY67_00278 [Bacteroidetes bacterium ADurb.Bin397]